MKQSFESLGRVEVENYHNELFSDLSSEFGRLILEKIQDPGLTPEAREAESAILRSLESRMDGMRQILEERKSVLEMDNIRNRYLFLGCFALGGLLTQVYPFAGFCLGSISGLALGIEALKCGEIDSMRKFNEVLHNSSSAINNRKEVIDQSDKYPEGE